MTKYVISGYIGFDNFGDEAIASVLVDYLKKNGAEKITYISSNPQKTSKLHDVSAVGMFSFIPEIVKSDVLISGGGSLLQDVTSLKSLIYYLLIILTALFFRKKVLIFAQGITPFRTKIAEKLAIAILKKCTEISVRDKKSQEYLKKFGILSTLVADPVFGLKTPVGKVKNVVGIQLRDYPSVTNKFLENLADIVAERFRDKDIEIISLQDNLDLKIAKQFKKMLKKRDIEANVKHNLSIKKAIKKFSVMEYLIAMRFHACLLGVKSGVKVLGINYDEKVEKLANDVGFPLIELKNNDFTKEFDELEKIDIKKYNIPQFRFEDIILLNSPVGY